MRDSVLEQWLTERQGVAFTYVEAVRIDDIVVDDQAKANIRFDQVSRERIDQYRSFLQQGAKFPAVVLFRRGKKYLVINGVHRLMTFKEEGVTVVDAYVCDLDEQRDASTITRLRRTSNTIEGLPLTHEECIEQAVQMVREGKSQLEAANEMGIKPGIVQRRIAQEDAKKRLAQANLPIGSLQETALEALNRIQRSALFKSAVELTIQARLSAETVHDLSREIIAAPSDSAGEKVIEKYRDEHAARIVESAKGRLRPSSAIVNPEIHVGRLASQVRRILHLRDVPKLSAVGLDSLLRRLFSLRDDIDEAIKFVEKLRSRVGGTGGSAVGLGAMAKSMRKA